VLAFSATIALAAQADESPPRGPSPAPSVAPPQAAPGDPARPSPQAADPTHPAAPLPVDDLPEPPRTAGDEETDPPYFDSPFLTLALHPLLLINPVVGVSAEVKVSRKVSVGGMVAGGSVHVKDPRTGEDTRAGLFMIGAQARYYVLQGFGSGFFVAFDADYNHIDTDQLVSLTLFNTAAGLGLGPLGGFKLVLPLGGTVDVGLGVKKILLRPTPSVATEEGKGDQPASVLFLLRFGAGWTF
jgi:hypothetical protein